MVPKDMAGETNSPWMRVLEMLNSFLASVYKWLPQRYGLQTLGRAGGGMRCPVQPWGTAQCFGMKQVGTRFYPPPKSCVDWALLSAGHIQSSLSYFNPPYPSRTLFWPPDCAVQSVLKWGGLPSLDQTPEQSHVLSQTLARNKCVRKSARKSRISKHGSIAGISFWLPANIDLNPQSRHGQILPHQTFWGD